MPVDGLDVATGVEEIADEMTRDADWLSSGEYVKAGLLVWFIGPLSTAACELMGAAKTGLLIGVITLLVEDETNRVEDVDDDGGLGVAGADGEGAGCGAGVKYEVESTVSAV